MKLSGAIYCTQHYRTLSVETRLMHCMLVGCVFLKKILASMCLFKNIQRIWKVNSASRLRENKHVACILKKISIVFTISKYLQPISIIITLTENTLMSSNTSLLMKEFLGQLNDDCIQIH